MRVICLGVSVKGDGKVTKPVIYLSSSTPCMPTPYPILPNPPAHPWPFLSFSPSSFITATTAYYFFPYFSSSPWYSFLVRFCREKGEKKAGKVREEEGQLWYVIILNKSLIIFSNGTLSEDCQKRLK